MNTKVLWSIVVLLAVAGTAAGANDAWAGLEKRNGQLKNVVVAYEFKVIPPQQADEERNRRTQGVSFQVTVGVERQLKFSYLDGKVRYESKEKNLPEMPPSDGTGTMVIMDDIANSAVEIVVDGSTELLCGYRDNAYFKGFIRDAASGEDNDAIGGPMGMRVGDKWVDAKMVAAYKVGETQNVGWALEFVQADGRHERWTLSPEHGYAPAIQEVVRPDGTVRSRTEMSDWQKIGDVWIAYKAVRIMFGKGEDGKPTEGSKYVFTVKSCEVGSKENVPALYKMVWPDGTKVKGKDGKMYEAKGGQLKPIEAKQTDSK